jgi:hypothetical protein
MSESVKRGAYFYDPAFQDELVKFLVHDRNFLRDFSAMLSPEDFRPRGAIEKRERETVAEVALNFWRLYRDPIGKLLKSEISHLVESKKVGENQRGRLEMYVERIVSCGRLKAVDALGNKIIQFKREKAKAVAVNRLFELQSAGKLTDETWLKTCQEGLALYNPKLNASDYWEEIDQRIQRRMLQQVRQRYPYLLIDPFDYLVRAVARGHIGLAMAPWKRGKSLFLLWVAFAYVLQGLDVSYWTLEDPKDDVEDRLDALVSRLPVKSLWERGSELRERFAWVKRSIRSKLKIYDGTEEKSGRVSVRTIEDVYERERNAGFTPQAIVVDYDDELAPPNPRAEKHEQQAAVYSDYRAFLGRKGLIGWIASQTGRDTENLKILSGSKIADAIGKVRKAHLVLGLGKGDWGDDSIYMYVDAHRSDRSHVGCNIITDKDSMVFYNREATLAMMKKVGGEQL